MTGAPVLTVVVPAHDEAAVIQRCLSALTREPDPRFALRVVVVCNGCHDGTAGLVRAAAARDDRISLVELEVGAKPAAIRAGLAHAAPGPVAVVDADVVLSPDALAGLWDCLAPDGARIAAPALVVDTSGCAPSVRRYYRVWITEPYVARGVIGAGVYAVSAAGRERLAQLPDVLADDTWAKRQFGPGERCTTPGSFTVFPARTTAALVRRRARVEAGNAELRALADPVPRAVPGPGPSRALPDRLAYRGVVRAAGLLAFWRARTGRSRAWGKDSTSRPLPA